MVKLLEQLESAKLAAKEESLTSAALCESDKAIHYAAKAIAYQEVINTINGEDNGQDAESTSIPKEEASEPKPNRRGRPKKAGSKAKSGK